MVALGKPVNAPCRANRTAKGRKQGAVIIGLLETLEFAQLRFYMIAGTSTDAAEVEPSRDRGKPVSEPCRANRTAAPPLPSRAEIRKTL